MSDNNLLPRLLADIEFPRSILKKIHNGKSPYEIASKYSHENINYAVNKLVEQKLVDHLSFIPIGAKQVRPGVYFLTNKGIRWLRTYDRWERYKYRLSKWQILWGIILGIFINIISGFVWPHIFELLSYGATLFGSAMEILSPVSTP